ncbi:FunK1 protein kinase [Lindgomyces ingoldianus]|uniref:FunK1 protein kinase n=1 Tax=Lindgomyces ingoldianus TaxID=673940 RepID=A0ACB6R602_9PLEO|nr:FunK1 protein kinase [Lindgomyces ingoldianus]KAF2474703.1 FunK1 protein kinase [Lindgomyces ingoldianus]
MDVFDNIKDRIHGPLGDFEPCASEDIQTAAKTRAFHFLRASPFVLPDRFLSWFANVCAVESEPSQSLWHMNVTSGGAHIFLIPSKTLRSGKEIWGDVRAIGNFSQDDSTGYRDGLLDLSLLARQVFISQPLRLFLYGFYVRESHLELWMFDRSGIWCCQAFNIQHEPERFLSLIFSYQLMSDQDLGRSKIIQNDENGNFVILDEISQSSIRKLYLDDQTIASSEDMVGQGTTCYRSRLADSGIWDYVVKFSWRASTKRPEEEIFKFAMDKKVWGILSLHCHKVINSTANLRRSLKFGPYREFLPKSRQPEKSDRSETDEKKEQDIAQHTRVTKTQFENRELVCIVTSPAGRRLELFTTRLELLLAMRDAIRAHRSLLQDARILHQDISPWNIIIVSPRSPGEPHGILIDLDASMNLDIGPRSEGEVVGTRPFMSIGILHSRRHTYRHDLESFLYVLIWLLIVKDKGSPPPGSRLKMWNRGTWEESADDKEYDMAEANFGRMILSEFAPEYESLKPLAEKMRSLLFPIEDGKLWTGTDGSVAATNALYDELIGAFEDAVLREKALVT